MTSSPIQTAVELREDSRKPAELTGPAAIKTAIEKRQEAIFTLLPDHVKPDQFVQTIYNACRAVPKLWHCEPMSVVTAVLQSARLGLEPNTHRNLAWILPYKEFIERKETGRVLAGWQKGYGGVMELARRADPTISFIGREVYPNDLFIVDFGEDKPLTHKPAVSLKLERGGDAYAWYVMVRYSDGRTPELMVLDKPEVMRHKSFSKQPGGMLWTEGDKGGFKAAALKSCVYELERFLPQSPDMAAAAASDNHALKIEEGQIVPADVDAETGEIGPGE